MPDQFNTRKVTTQLKYTGVHFTMLIYICRCIRPNESKMPDQFDTRKVTTQLKYTGVLETTRIRREGYSHRIPFNEFMKRYTLS